MTSPTLEVLLRSMLTSVAAFGEVVITVVHTELTAEALNVAVAAGRKAAAVYSGGSVGLALVNVNIKLPSGELRRAASEAMAATKNDTRCVARVFLGQGFWMSTKRSVLTAIELIRPYDIPRGTFSELRAATRWLASASGHDTAWAGQLEAAASRVAGITAHAPSHAP